MTLISCELSKQDNVNAFLCRACALMLSITERLNDVEVVGKFVLQKVSVCIFISTRICCRCSQKLLAETDADLLSSVRSAASDETATIWLVDQCSNHRNHYSYPSGA